MARGSTEDLRSLLHSVKAPNDSYGMDYIKDEEFVSVVKTQAPQLIEKFESRSFVWTNPSELNSDTLLQSYCDIQAENRLLHLLLKDLNDKTNKTSPSAAAPSVGVAAAIQRVQKALVRQSGEQKLAETVYKSSHMPYNKFSNATRGILLMKRGLLILNVVPS